LRIICPVDEIPDLKIGAVCRLNVTPLGSFDRAEVRSGVVLAEVASQELAHRCSAVGNLSGAKQALAECERIDECKDYR